MVIYKIVVREELGDEPQIDSRIYFDLNKARNYAKELSDTGCADVRLYKEIQDMGCGYFRTIGEVKY